MTNREKLNKMSNNELYETLHLYRVCPSYGLSELCEHPDWTCSECWATWFNAEAEAES